MRCIELVERFLGRTAQKRFLPMQPGDVPDTWADTSDLSADLHYRPTTPIETGVQRFIAWYCDYYQVGGVRNACGAVR